MRMPNLSLPPPAAPVPLDEGMALGVWRVRQPLSDGEQAHAGQWYRAEHGRASEQQAAVLVLDRNDQGAGVMLRYADQAGDLARLQHPQIAVPSDSGVTPHGHPYLIVEGEHGSPLLPQLAELTLDQRVTLLVELCEALRSAHQQGWLLAELDPAMIWRDRQGRLRLMGLGLARIPDPTDPFDRGLSLGAAPAFVAPERRAGGPPSLASEVYSLGAFAQGLLAGWLETSAGLAPRREPLAAAWPAQPVAELQALEALLDAALSNHPEQRPVGAEALADELRAWLGQSGRRELAAGPKASPLAPAGARRWWWLGVLLAGLLVSAWLLRSGPVPASDTPATQPASTHAG